MKIYPEKCIVCGRLIPEKERKHRDGACTVGCWMKWKKNKLKKENVNPDDYRRVMEKILNRKLLLGEIVHHKDGDHFNNNVDNLEVIDYTTHFYRHRVKTFTPDGKVIYRMKILKSIMDSI